MQVDIFRQESGWTQGVLLEPEHSYAKCLNDGHEGFFSREHIVKTGTHVYRTGSQLRIGHVVEAFVDTRWVKCTIATLTPLTVKINAIVVPVPRSNVQELGFNDLIQRLDNAVNNRTTQLPYRLQGQQQKKGLVQLLHILPHVLVCAIGKYLLRASWIGRSVYMYEACPGIVVCERDDHVLVQCSYGGCVEPFYDWIPLVEVQPQNTSC